MPRPTSEASRAWSQGYQRGSIMDKADNAEKKRLRGLIDKDGKDQKAFESTARAAGWVCAKSRSQRSMQEV